jgi:hypothetical protein
MPKTGYFSDHPFRLSADFLLGSTRDFNLGAGLGFSYCYMVGPVACLQMGGGVDYTEGFGPYSKPANASSSFYEKGVHPYAQLGMNIFPSHHWGFGLWSGAGSPTSGKTLRTQDDYSGGGFMWKVGATFLVRINDYVGFHFDAGLKTLPSLMDKEDRHWGFESRTAFDISF